jgi:hypothetical protein
MKKVRTLAVKLSRKISEQMLTVELDLGNRASLCGERAVKAGLRIDLR